MGSGADRVLFSVGLDFHAWDISLRDFTDQASPWMTLDVNNHEKRMQDDGMTKGFDKKLVGEVSQCGEDM